MAHRPPTHPGRLLTRADIQVLFGWNRSWTHSVCGKPDFPAPIDDGHKHRHPIWDRQVVEKWAKENDVELHG